MRIAGAGRVIFAATMIGFGIWGVVSGDFGAIWRPVPRDAPAREALAYVCASVSLASGVGLLWRRTAAPAARGLLAGLLIWLVLFRAPGVWRAPAVAASWESFAEAVVVAAGAWALYARFATEWDARRLGFASGAEGVRIARALYGLAMIVFGLAHFAYVKLTASLAPGWLPSPTAWVWFTGTAYIVAGVAMLSGVLARLAATLSALQMGLFTLLVWGPAVASGGADASQWSEAAISWALTAAGWVVAESYRDAPWFALGRRRAAADPEAAPV